MIGSKVRWADKPETRETIRLIIRDKVWTLPERPYPEEDLPKKIDEIFNYFYSREAAA